MDRNSGQVTNLQHLRLATFVRMRRSSSAIGAAARSSTLAKEFPCPSSTPSAASGSAWAAASVKAKAFDRVDTNDDRKLDQAELQAAFDAVAAKTGKTARDAEAVIAKIDPTATAR